MKRGEVALTTEELMLAFRHLRRNDGPQTLEAALQHPVMGPGLKGLARQFCREGRPTPTRHYRPPTPLGAPPLPPTPSAPPSRVQLSRLLPRFDARKAAANDKDD